MNLHEASETSMNLRAKFLSNLSYAFIAQLIAMVISIATNLILPRFIGVESYSYWQLFIFYSQYIPCLHLGLNDGVYLRYGGTPYQQLDKRRIKTQLLLGLCYQSIFCVMLCVASTMLVTDVRRTWSVYLVCLYFVCYTVQYYLGYIYQAANEITWHSVGIILGRVFFMAAILANVILGQRTCWPYIIGYILSQAIASAYTIHKGMDILQAPLAPLRDGARELWESIRAGSKLMLANTASQFVLGSGRQIVDMYWGLTAFGKVSFSITLTNFILSFIQQVGLVLFPTLRQLEPNARKRIYEKCRTGMFFLLPLVLIGYFPVKAMLGIWLPDYRDSLRYLALMLPVCLYDTRMQMLCSTYLKVLRKERLLLAINLLAVGTSIVIGLLGAAVFREMNAVVIGMVFAVALRSAVSEFYLAGQMGISIRRYYVQETIYVVVFMLAAWFLGAVHGTLVMIGCYGCLLGMNYREMRVFAGEVAQALRGRR